MTNSEIDRTVGQAAGKLADVLFGDDGPAKLFAVIDGAQVSGLLDVLDDQAPPSECLFAGKLDPSVALVAPYLVEVERGSPFADWVLERVWGKDACVFLRSELELKDVRKHLKTLTMARLPDGEQVFFRFYDPRVLRVYLPTCDEAEVGEVMGEVVECFLVESEGAGSVLEFGRSGGGVGGERAVEG